VRGADGAEVGDIIFCVADEYVAACKVLGALRVALGSPPVGEGPHTTSGDRVPDVRGCRRGRPPDGGPPPLYDASPEDLELIETDP